jgi:hypothetical protein
MTYVREGNVLRRVVIEPKVEPNVDMWSVFNDIPTDLTKEQLVVLGAELGVKLTMRQKEATMIEKIYESIELGV